MNLISNRDLFDLVKSLSKSEKRFLKLTASASDLNPNLIHLFNTIELASDYKEDFFTKILNQKQNLFKLKVRSQKIFTISF